MPDFRKLTLLFLSLSIATGCSRHTTDVRQSLAQAAQLQGTEGSPRLLAAYQPWFGEPKHINVGYSSHDPNVLARQVSEAKGLGIDAFVVNWYGPRKQFEDQSYALLQQAASQNSFQTAIMYDEDTEYVGQNTEAVLVDLQYAYDRYIGPHAVASRSAYLRFNGRPMIFIFPKSGGTDWARVREVVNSWEDPPLLIFKDINTHYPNAFDGFYAWVQPGREGWQRDGSNWGEQYLQDFYTRMSSQYPSKIAVGAAWPGFNDTRASWSQNRHMSDRCGRTFEESVRLFRRYYNDSRQLPFLMIVTWNDYEEGTAIEHGINACNSGNTQSAAAAASGQ